MTTRRTALKRFGAATVATQPLPSFAVATWPDEPLSIIVPPKRPGGRLPLKGGDTSGPAKPDPRSPT